MVNDYMVGEREREFQVLRREADLLTGAMSGSMVLMQLWWSVLMSVAPVTTKGPADVCRLSHYL